MRKTIKYTALALVVSLMSFGVFRAYQAMVGNFHPVVPGEVYRSAQLGEGDIAEYKEDYGIRSVLNLRGENKGTDWYDDETAEAKAQGVKHINFRMSASHELTNEQALELIEVMRNAPKPMLIHCQAGADRTGLASAIYLAAIAKKGEWAAERQMWLHYGHIPFAISAAVAMNRTFERLEPLFGYQGS